ncbi:ABC transporter permease [Natrialba sp. SSL1]|uniref:ABC transporter permease n=1 Tax=Natrialba sp. SSL1 TaxID=1869245 RepID=UPI0008F93C6F|nr:ABC transporter permease [Natrialba sp. SSL1]OIB59038.1 ABC transporter permease [Natrialba sp. SSL1]
MSALSSAWNLLERVAYNHGRKAGLTCLVLAILYLWFPIFVVTFMSFAEREVLTFPPSSLTLDWYLVFLDNDAAISATITSLQISFITTPIAVALSVLIAYAIDRYVFPGKSILQLVAVLPIVVPLIVVGVAMTIFFGIVGIQASFWTVVAAHVIRVIPFTVLILVPTLVAFDRSLEEASYDLGANELTTFRKITVPNIMPGVVAAGLLAFTISFNEFVYTYFVKDARTQTLPTYLWDQLRQHATPEVNVISVVFIVFAISTVLIAVALTNVERITTHDG